MLLPLCCLQSYSKYFVWMTKSHEISFRYSFHYIKRAVLQKTTSQGGTEDVRLFSVQVLSFSCSLGQNKLQNNRLAHPLWQLAPHSTPPPTPPPPQRRKILDPPLISMQFSANKEHTPQHTRATAYSRNFAALSKSSLRQPLWNSSCLNSYGINVGRRVAK